MSLVTATIRTEALRHNLAIARKAAPNSNIMAVIKANAYGHGAVEAAKALAQANAFAVARIEEALSLRQADIDKPIVILSELLDTERVEACAEHGFQPVVHDTAGVEAILAAPGLHQMVVWLKVDTGMHRLGISPDDCDQVYGQLSACPHVSEVRLMTHFSSADEDEDTATEDQMERFSQATANLSGIGRSLANSAAILSHKQSHAEWVRPGIMLYGADPLPTANDLSSQLRPVMQLQSRVIAVREIEAGEGVGYNETWRSDRRSRIGTIAFGYADGYPRHARNGTPVVVDGKTVPLVGRVSMDMITVDLTDHPDTRVGSVVLLWGDGLPAERVAEYADTIPYQLFTSVGGRTQFVYS
jgi:alanine racemase